MKACRGSVRGSGLDTTGLLGFFFGTSGLKWERTGEIKPANGRELTEPKLTKTLAKQTRFSKKDWDKFGISDLRYDDFIQSGNAFFRPAGPFTRHFYKAGQVKGKGEETEIFRGDSCL